MTTTPINQERILVDTEMPTSTNSFEDVYDFESFLQEGAFSMVGKARHRESDRRVAVKVCDKNSLTTDKQRWRIQNEIAIHKTLKHPNIVDYFEHYESDTDVYIVMELLDGGELYNRVSDNSWFSEKEASVLIKQLTDAVLYLHTRGIVHRDIKPENVLFKSKSPDSTIKLIDFGLSKQVTNEQGRAFLMKSSSGTPAWSAPEKITGTEESKAVDMWSVGCIMYLLLFSVPPFWSSKQDEEEHDDEVISAIISNKITYDKRQLSPSGLDLLTKLMHPQPSERITAEEVLEHPWITDPPSFDAHMADTNSSQSSFSQKMERDLLKHSMNKVIDFNTQNIFSP